MPHKVNQRIKSLIETIPGVSQGSVAEAIGIKQPTLNRRFSSSKMAFSHEEIETIAELLGVTPDDILNYNYSYSETVAEEQLISYRPADESKIIRNMQQEILTLNEIIIKLKERNRLLEENMLFFKGLVEDNFKKRQPA